MSETTRITRKGQTTIPQELREKHGLEPGDTVVWEETDDGIVVRKEERTGARGLLAGDMSEDEREGLAAELGDEIRAKREDDWSVE
ncbi:AbrB/MazE/SpoVT family DNA-binding domain-containing protein [Halorussus salilacus]|uniref:AbrB/MazE/SpoVT family DNA-binding domain-containing protein n=1 Tax=Halorussus salilacus TaxID=2953750 RepID=UPI00209EA68D|nr:AbrB/MazE/SpoVT family DNA-binding domain-containing protein [Halorussus salilacus]USZ69020.1 AbrB/MazE/SpoVT family DNA-binding domain-containing protein [Halorussus salilacus]